MQLSMPSEYLPSTGNARQDLVLLHGWSCNREIWRPLLGSLRPWANVTLVDIPGLAPGVDSADADISAVLDSILDCAPAEAVYLGWSLGGQLAIALAHHAPERVTGVVTLCSNPCFVAKEDWPGMEAEALAQFHASALADMGKTLRRFDSLQVMGARYPRGLLRALQSMRMDSVGAGMTVGLTWLAELDLRDQYRNLQQPQLHLQGDSDGMLPKEVVPALRELIADRATASITILEESSHLAPVEASSSIASAVLAFLQRERLLTAAVSSEQTLAKADVALSFSRAARNYDSVAQLQRDVGEALLARLDALQVQPSNILDLGCGTGHFLPELQLRFPEAAYLGLDLAEGMVGFARESHPQPASWLVGDAEALPFAADSVDLIFSSLALQWCQRPELLFAELARVLRPGGHCVFTSLGPDTLKELRSSWEAVDQHQHVNSFLAAEALHAAIARFSQLSFSMETKPYRMQYSRVSDLLNELKTLGAHNVNRQRPAGLTGRRALQGMMQSYEDWREQGMLPASYEVFFGILEKT